MYSVCILRILLTAMADRFLSIVLILTGAAPKTITFPFPFMSEETWAGIVPKLKENLSIGNSN